MALLCAQPYTVGHHPQIRCIKKMNWLGGFNLPEDTEALAPPLSLMGQDFTLISLLESVQTLKDCLVLTKLVRDSGKPDVY